MNCPMCGAAQRRRVCEYCGYEYYRTYMDEIDDIKGDPIQVEVEYRYMEPIVARSADGTMIIPPRKLAMRIIREYY